MARREMLQRILIDILGSPNVYFQPPASVRMSFPAIVYERDIASTIFANNKPYRYEKLYKVTVVDKNPDSDIPDKVAKLPTCVHEGFFTRDELNHDVFKLFF